jgi:hypothetical protein
MHPIALTLGVRRRAPVLHPRIVRMRRMPVRRTMEVTTTTTVVVTRKRGRLCQYACGLGRY